MIDADLISITAFPSDRHHAPRAGRVDNVAAASSTAQINTGVVTMRARTEWRQRRGFIEWTQERLGRLSIDVSLHAHVFDHRWSATHKQKGYEQEFSHGLLYQKFRDGI